MKEERKFLLLDVEKSVEKDSAAEGVELDSHKIIFTDSINKKFSSAEKMVKYLESSN